MPYYARMARTNPTDPLTILNREARLLCGALIVGAVPLPLLVWVTGRSTLGPYANGGLLAILGDFFTLLFSGSLAAAILLVGPYALLSLLRLAAAIFRRI